MSEYIYNILVLDDMVDIKEVFEIYKDHIREKSGYKVEFHLVSNEDELKKFESIKFDIVMIDYDLSQGLFKTTDGNEWVRTVRQKNGVCKIIFYSSEFEYSESNRAKCRLKLSSKEIFDLVNEYKVDAIVSKNNFEMLINCIIDNIKNVDPISKLLIEMRQQYSYLGEIFYYEIDGERISLDRLLNEYQSDTRIGKEFGKELAKTLASGVMTIDY